jgi:hypothetical protein
MHKNKNGRFVSLLGLKMTPTFLRGLRLGIAESSTIHPSLLTVFLPLEPRLLSQPSQAKKYPPPFY